MAPAAVLHNSAISPMMNLIPQLAGQMPASPPATKAKSASPDVGCSVTGAERDYISFSAIRTYQTCPLRYYFKYVAGLPEESVAAALVFGSAIHRAIEHHFRALM